MGDEKHKGGVSHKLMDHCPPSTLTSEKLPAGQGFHAASCSASSRYRTIVADPPWAYKTRMRGNMTKGEMRSVDFNEYPTMSIDEIAAMPVKELAENDAHLYLWTT